MSVIFAYYLPRLLPEIPSPTSTTQIVHIATTQAGEIPSIAMTTQASTVDFDVLAAQTLAVEANETATASSPTPSHTLAPTEDRSGTLAAITNMTRTHFADQTLQATGRVGIDTKVTNNAEWQQHIAEYARTFESVEMVLVPKGCFMMGRQSGESREKPVIEICFDAPFWIDRYEVTNVQYGSTGNWNRDQYPRETVSWFDAKIHCESRVARLPTEAEWEYAARGPDGLVYPWGNAFMPGNVVYKRNSNHQPAPVGSKRSGGSWTKTYDMSGNLWEWTSSLYESYPYNEEDGREADLGDNTDVLRVIRGGSFDVIFSSHLSTTFRNANDPDDESHLIGFRCVRDWQSGD